MLYFVRKGKSKEESDVVLSLSKLKTLEYRIYRKLREKLRNYLNQPKNKNLYNKFVEETRDHCEKATPARPLE